jgi:hypothetical protein
MEQDRGFCLKLFFYAIDAQTLNKASESIVNRTVCYLDPPFCHCELQFMNGESLAVYANTRVSLRRRTFDDPQYSHIKIPCTRQQYDTSYTCANAMINLPFSWLALLNCKLRIWSYPNKTTFCSKLCCDVLNAAKLIKTPVQSNFVTPSALHKILQLESSSKPTDNQISIAIDFQN